MEKAYKLLAAQEGISNKKAKELIDRGLVYVGDQKIRIARAEMLEETKFRIEEPAEVKIIYQDDFSDPATGWPVSKDAEGESAYKDGAYLIRVNTTQLNLWVVAGYPQLRNVVVGVTARVDTSVGDGDFGLICRYQDQDNFYGLEISEDGYTSIWKVSQGEYAALVQWQKLPRSLRQQEIYTLEAVCLGNHLTLTVNGQVVAEAQDSEFRTGDVGMIVGTWDTPGFGVLFDDFVIRQP